MLVVVLDPGRAGLVAIEGSPFESNEDIWLFGVEVPGAVDMDAVYSSQYSTMGGRKVGRTF